MDFQRKEKRAKINIDSDLSKLYPHDLQLYRDYPDTEISLIDFEQWAVERLKVLRILEHISIRVGTKNYEEWKNLVVEELRKQGLRMYLKLITSPGSGQAEPDYEARKRDHSSHYILRIAYCQSEEYRRWLIARELELFKLRWSYLTPTAKQAFIKLNNLDYSPISEDAVQELSVETNGWIKSTMEYYRVNWVEVCDLVRTRRVYINQGFAYVSSTDLISVLGSLFRSNLSHFLSIASSKLQILRQDERVDRLIRCLHNTYTGKSYNVNESGKKIPLNSIDSLAKTSFPLCMRQLHASLCEDHHLRHFGRQQFSLFLKGIGLTLEDALVFWKNEFTKKIDGDKFDKQYAYNIRHNYGKEGKRTNYTPYSCAKIISSSVSPGDQHGCPFKHYDSQHLKQLLVSCNVSQQDIQDMLNYVNQGHYQLACAKYFEIKHNVPMLSAINHPNQYFEESQKIMSNKAGSAAQTDAIANSIPTSSGINQSKKSPETYSLNDSELAAMDLDNIE